MSDYALAALGLLNLAGIGLLWWRQGRAGEAAGQALERLQLVQALELLGDQLDRLERELRREVAESARGQRQEQAQGLGSFQEAMVRQGAEAARGQHERLDALAQQLVQLRGSLGDSISQQWQALSEANARRLAELRTTLEAQLQQLQQGNAAKLDEMRATVDEKLHRTLETRLSESFAHVAQRLEQVHKGLGEMQNLARDVGSLNRVLTNVKTRGVFGEVQLAGLLDQVFTPEQYAANVATLPGSSERVEFAISLPGQRDDGQPLWLPIDAKFPREDYERLLDAQERADAAAAEASAKAIETRLRLEAKTIRDKYIGPPHTTDFAILFVPTEGLYAEALRRPGLMESLQREHRVMLAGPTTLLATLNSLQMGFRTLALEKRSAEVWEVLGAVKTEFGKFGDVLAKAKKKLEEA
ncbi:MAG: hypothetical protein RJA36_521, partial [Pseudomonadota bacterium]